MDRKRMRYRLLPLLLVLCLALTGCRARIYGDGTEAVPGDGGEAAFQDGGIPETPEAAEPDETSEMTLEEPGERTKENPDSPRKEYDENAEAEIVPGTERQLHGPGAGTGASADDPEAPEAVYRLDDAAEEAATQTVAAQEAEQTGVDPDAEEADSAMTYFSVLLQERMGSLFECQRANVYWETAEDHRTVHKTSPEHQLILDAGAYDVSARLLPENLTVDDGWVLRKNPQVIVKMVDSGVLGSGVNSVRTAQGVRQGLAAREGWSGIDAVRSGKMLLLSGEMLEAPHLRLAAMLLVAETADPELFRDVDMGEALTMLCEEAAGAPPAGIMYYTGKED